jgi:ribosomal protein L37AE/L43A
VIFDRDTYACSHCGERRPRDFVHRNRAGAYICHPCWAVQRKKGYWEVTRVRLRLALHRASRTAVLLALGALSLIAIVWVLVMLFA